ncbi:GNAT family N-acetyltransferase [Tateyamaria omphalii]|uniref:GNAT family N-acetyltransferase n=1 Tax=Tateyamaria omphalii TaxID=299262 RepID=UPI001E61617C|nr:GNAT family N-acetyltransferase [Tateyamaria omphalii]
MSAFLRELTALGKRLSPDDEEFVQRYYIEGEDKIRCSVADDEGAVLGFQSLKIARAGNQWGVEPGWGIVGTHIRPSAARRGVGRALFEVTRKAAEDAGLAHIDASIGANNPEGLAYYEAMGFRTYRTSMDLICKRFDISR